jgi:hypothetical protein
MLDFSPDKPPIAFFSLGSKKEMRLLRRPRGFEELVQGTLPLIRPQARIVLHHLGRWYKISIIEKDAYGMAFQLEEVLHDSNENPDRGSSQISANMPSMESSLSIRSDPGLTNKSFPSHS